MDVWDLYKEAKSINALYDWQREFLEQYYMMGEHESFILSLPCGAGKTLVAEMLLLRETIIRKKNCMIILPYVAIVKEKMASLADFEDKWGIIIEEYAASKGRYPPIKRRSAQSIYVCTIEKANILVNSFLEQCRLNEIGLVIVDELHMLGESGDRGAILEQCLCKLMHQRNENSEKIQIIGMSATLANTDELCAFLSAKKYQTNFRPVRVLERIKLHDELYQVDTEGSWQLELHLPKKNIPGLEKLDPDGLSLLLGNFSKGQILIFCPTKSNCENLCKLLANICPKEFREHRAGERMTILTQLRDEHDGQICPILNEGIKHGVAYHHSGLTQDERILIESAYKNGILSIICCTSTLATGVNLPARRVIIRSPYVGRNPLKKSQYLQMIGRAGRAGIDEKGDSIVILHHGNEANTFRKMQSGPLEPCLSSLSDEQQREAFFLDLIVLKLCSSFNDLYKILKNTLFGIQTHDEVQIHKLTEKTVQSLLDKQMLIQPEIGLFFATQIGSATFNANLNPQMALEINKDLSENLGQGLVLSSHFHLLYNCVPLDVELQNLDWNLFHNEYLTLAKEERQLVDAMGFPESTIIQYILSISSLKNLSNKARRLYVAFMLRHIWNQRPLWEVAEYFSVPRGWLQATVQSAFAQSSSIVRFAERTPSLWALKSLLPEMIKRLSECTRQELIPLLALECVRIGRARLLYEHGYRTVGLIARAKPQALTSVMAGKLSRVQAARIINSAKILIRDHIAEKAEELEQLGADLFVFPANKPLEDTSNLPLKKKSTTSASANIQV